MEIDISIAQYSGLIRLGKEEKRGNRPLLVTLPTEKIKDEMFKKLASLKGTAYEKVSIKHDMTPLERQAHTRLVAKAKLLNEMEAKKGNPGNVEFRVRGPPWKKFIAKLKKKSDGSGKLEIIETLYEKDLQSLLKPTT